MTYLYCIQLLLKTAYLIIQNDFPMKHELDLQAPATTKVLFKLTIIGCVLLGCVYGFLVLFNSALAAIK